jgi:hypothetical protein
MLSAFVSGGGEAFTGRPVRGVCSLSRKGGAMRAGNQKGAKSKCATLLRDFSTSDEIRRFQGGMAIDETSQLQIGTAKINSA